MKIGFLSFVLILFAVSFSNAQIPHFGRPKIINNTIVTSEGERLRGGTFWIYGGVQQNKITWSQTEKPWNILHENGFNAIRLAIGYRPQYPDSYPFTLDDFEVLLDWYVAKAKQEGIYVIIDLHDRPGTYNMITAKAFWNRFAPRYADDENVIYELTNEPVSWRPGDYTDANLRDFEELWQIADSNAPDTPIIILSFAIVGKGTEPTPKSVTERLYDGQSGEPNIIDWSKTIVGFHSYRSFDPLRIIELKKAYPVIDTEFEKPNSGDDMAVILGFEHHGTLMEYLNISWLQWDIIDRSDKVINLENAVDDLILHNLYWPKICAIIQPQGAIDAGAKWRRAGTSTWFDSGSYETNIQIGHYTLEFKDIPGWTKPPEVEVDITSGSFTPVQVTYTEETGNIKVLIVPPNAIDAGAKWRRAGTSTWFDSGEIETGIPMGPYLLEFEEVQGWSKPPDYEIFINESAIASIEYFQNVAVKETPKKFNVWRPFPNPMNSITTIRYEIPSESYVSLIVYDIKGRRIATLTEGIHPAGIYNAIWNGKDDNNLSASSGVYLCCLKAGLNAISYKILFLK